MMDHCDLPLYLKTHYHRRKNKMGDYVLVRITREVATTYASVDTFQADCPPDCFFGYDQCELGYYLRLREHIIEVDVPENCIQLPFRKQASAVR